MASEVTQVEAFANFSDSESDGDDIRFAGGSGRGRGEAKNPEDAEALHDVQAFDVDVEGDDESDDDVFGFHGDNADNGDEELESAGEGAEGRADGEADTPDVDSRRSRRRGKTEYSPVHAIQSIDVADGEGERGERRGRRDKSRRRRRGEGKFEEGEDGEEDEEDEEKPADTATTAVPRHHDFGDSEEEEDDVVLGSPPTGRRRGVPSASTSVFSSSTGAYSSERTSGRSSAPVPGPAPSAFEPDSDALLRVPPRVMQCVVVRNRRGMNRFYPQYQMYWQDKDSEVLLMCAQKQRSNKTSNYHIFDMTMGVVGSKLSKKHRNYMGKVRTSFRKHDCAVYGPGENPKQLEDSPVPMEQRLAAVRPEMAAVFFRKVSVVSHLTEGPVVRGAPPSLPPPRKMHVALPAVDPETGKPCDYKVLKEEQSLLARAAEDSLEPFIQLDTKEPTFQNGTYRLNFHQRVTEASVKNFQLIMSTTAAGETQRAREVYEPEFAQTKASVGRAGKGLQRSEDIVMQFGKVGDDRFHLDFRAPLTPFQAFAVCLCQFNL